MAGADHMAGHGEDAVPLERSVPIAEYHSAPRARMPGREAMVSTLLMDRRAGVQALDRREGGLETRMAAAALQGVEQCRLLPADVGAGARVRGDGQRPVAVEAEAVLQQPRVLRLGHGAEQSAVGVGDLARR